jgi:Holliday junction resolvase RusA-like endonuclease
MTQSFHIDGTLPGMNDIIAITKQHRRAYNDMKKTWDTVVWAYIKKAKLKPMSGYVAIHLTWIEADNKRDPDNIRAGIKFILDALVTAKILSTDSSRQIYEIRDTFEVAHRESAGVFVTLTEVVVPI